jgi:glycosyltransferase involved in cell wall biosynthesis
MRIGLVVDVDYPHVGEVRPMKLARSLHKAGHSVVFMCANSRKRPVMEDLDYGRVYRFSRFLKSTMFSLLAAPMPLNLLWTSWLRRIARTECLDVLVCSNIRLALPTILAGKRLRIPVVLDLQENNREAVKLYAKTRFYHHAIRNSRLVGFFEDLSVKLADHTWVVVQERIDALPPRLRGKASVVCHTPNLEDLAASEKLAREPQNENFALVYVGLFTPGMGSIEPILQALPYVLAVDKKVVFLIGGGGGYLEPLVKELGIQDHVVFEGLIEPAKVTAWLRRGNLGIIAYAVNPYSNSTVSNKLFHYMVSGLPILSTDMAPTRRILQEVGCGVTFPANSSPKEIADIILQLKNAPEKRAEMAARGRQAVLEKYNWEADFRRALACLENLVEGRRSDNPRVEAKIHSTAL